MSASTEEELYEYFNGFLSDDEVSETDCNSSSSTCVKTNATDKNNQPKENTSPQPCVDVSSEDALWEYFNQSDDDDDNDLLSTGVESNCKRKTCSEIQTNSFGSNVQALKSRPRVKLEKKFSMKLSSIIAQENTNLSETTEKVDITDQSTENKQENADASLSVENAVSEYINISNALDADNGKPRRKRNGTSSQAPGQKRYLQRCRTYKKPVPVPTNEEKLRANAASKAQKAVPRVCIKEEIIDEVVNNSFECDSFISKGSQSILSTFTSLQPRIKAEIIEDCETFPNQTDCPIVISASSCVASQPYVKKEIVEDDGEKFPTCNEDRTASSSDVLSLPDEREIEQSEASLKADKLEVKERSEKGLFNCKLCTYSTNYHHNFAKHSLSEHGIGRPFKCDRCFRCYKRYCDYKKHLIPISERPYKCKKCKIGFFRPKELTAHFERHRKYGDKHKLVNRFTSIIPGDCIYFQQTLSRTRRKCVVCFEQFSCYFDLRQHMQSSHDYSDSLFRCDICIQPYASQKQLNRHFAKFHPKVKRCLICNKRFRFLSDMRKHIGMHCR